MKKYLALIAVRKGSQRVQNKNIRNFCGTSLLEIKVKQAMSCKFINEVVVSSDCEKMLKLSTQLGAKVHKREEFYCSSTVPMNSVYEHLARNIDCEHVVYLHATSPFLTDKSLEGSIIKYEEKIKIGYDSLASVEKIKKYLWYNNKPVNYDPSMHPRSQDLPNFLALNFAINIIKRKDMIKYKNILSDIEGFDIDEEFDFLLAKKIYNQTKTGKKIYV